MTQTLHLKAPENWINDPNGFLYYKGNYHLFYQYYPYGPRWGTMHWGHAVSKDLVTWDHKGIALHPSVPEDEDGCFSGSAVEHDGKMVLFYTGVKCDRPEHAPKEGFREPFTSTQLKIESEDGFTFDNEGGKAVILPALDDPAVGDRMHTRDPKVWRGTDAWYMILGTQTADEGGKLLIYRSEDLDTWELKSQTSMHRALGWMWECPNYFEVGDQKVLLLSPMQMIKDGKVYDSHAISMVVGFDESTCRLDLPEEYELLDYGMDLYAPQTTLDEEGRNILVGWMRMPEAVDGRWNGMFCMPRVVEVENGHVYYRLHPNLKKAFSREIRSPKEASSQGYSIHLDLEEGEAMYVGGYRIARKGGRIETDRSAVLHGHPELRSQFFSPTLKDGCRLDIYVEPNLIEVYINDGEYVISNIVYDLTGELAVPLGKDVLLKTTE